MLNYRNEFFAMVVAIALAVSLAILNLIQENEVAYSLKIAFVITVVLLAAQGLEAKLGWLRRCWQIGALLLLLAQFAITFGWMPK
jgi:hypothetical protein